MKGNILFVDYDLSSWQHYDYDKFELPYTQMEKYLLGIEKPSPNSNIVVKHNENSFLTLKGNGSIHGGQWRPHPDKPWEERFFGKPGEIKRTFIPTKKVDIGLKQKSVMMAERLMSGSLQTMEILPIILILTIIK
ncbi:MAG: hypothetical protein K2L19_06440 [Eubacterium sp.]|nr:hypothetical protein [Eubacterium sp.]